jgi:hypothetical protein
MIKQGDIVQFHATTEGWGIIDWELSGADEEYVELLEHLDGEVATVTDVIIDSHGEPLYVDLRFDDLHNLYAISIVHVEPVKNVIPFRRKAS